MSSRTAPTQPSSQRSTPDPYTLNRYTSHQHALHRNLSRRQLLKLLGASACTATLGGLLAACSDASGSVPDDLDVPVGSFTAAQVSVPCGLAGGGVIIGEADDPASFKDAARSSAQILWLGQGFVEYTVPVRRDLAALEVSAELCSEANLHDNAYLSDITLWLNGVAVGTWTSPGDFGDRPGRHTPSAWWDQRFTQYGELKTWRVDAQGSFLDGVQVSEVTLAELNLSQVFSIRLGVAEDAQNVGGMNLFGRGFGDYEQGLRVKYQYG